MVDRVSELLRSLRDDGPSTRSQLAERVGASRGTISSDVADLVGAGLVEDAPGTAGSGGRPSSLLQVGGGLRLLAVSVGESRVRVALLGGGLTILRGLGMATSDVDAESLSTWTADAAASLVAEDGGAQPSAIGVAWPRGLDGPLQVFGEDARLPPMQVLVDEVVGRFDERPVAEVSAARAMALGERHSGDARGCRDFLALRLGFGVTCAAVVDGRLLVGDSGRAGDIGHHKVDDFGPACTCGNSGCLDSFAGTTALLKQATEAAEAGRSPYLADVLAQVRALETRHLADAVAAGDRASVQLARDAGRRVGDAVAGLVAFANPSRVVVGGPLAAMGDNLVSEVRSTVHRRSPVGLTRGLGVELSTLGERAVLVGAAHAASDGAFDERRPLS